MKSDFFIKSDYFYTNPPRKPRETPQNPRENPAAKPREVVPKTPRNTLRYLYSNSTSHKQVFKVCDQ